ncbi:MAG: hypothetical protein PHD95_05245 [Candidatus ainarchaeum sp.]|nr:hypothetical protein [Candidatus ainarchaeum sp.]
MALVKKKFKIPTLRPDTSKISHSNKLYFGEYYDALRKRLEIFCFQERTAMELNALPANNDSLFLLRVFIFAYIVNTCAILDNVCWCLNYFYDLKCDKYDIGMRFSNKKEKEFLKKLNRKNANLAQKLDGKDIQEWIDWFEEYRDIIQHRSMIHVMPVQEAGKQIAIKIPSDPTLAAGVPVSKGGKLLSYEENWDRIYKEKGNPFIEIEKFYCNTTEKITSIISALMEEISDGKTYSDSIPIV